MPDLSENSIMADLRRKTMFDLLRKPTATATESDSETDSDSDSETGSDDEIYGKPGALFDRHGNHVGVDASPDVDESRQQASNQFQEASGDTTESDGEFNGDSEEESFGRNDNVGRGYGDRDVKGHVDGAATGYGDNAGYEYGDKEFNGREGAKVRDFDEGEIAEYDDEEASIYDDEEASGYDDDDGTKGYDLRVSEEDLRGTSKDNAIALDDSEEEEVEKKEVKPRQYAGHKRQREMSEEGGGFYLDREDLRKRQKLIDEHWAREEEMEQKRRGHAGHKRQRSASVEEAGGSFYHDNEETRKRQKVVDDRCAREEQAGFGEEEEEYDPEGASGGEGFDPEETLVDQASPLEEGFDH